MFLKKKRNYHETIYGGAMDIKETFQDSSIDMESRLVGLFRRERERVRVLSNLRLPWKTELPWNFSLYWIYVIHSGVLSNLRLPWQTELSRNFSLHGIYSYIQNFWASSTCPEKQSCPDIFTVLNMYFLLFRSFEQPVLVLKNRGCPDIFHCIEYIFYYSGFLSNLWLPWKQSCPDIIHCIERVFFIIHDFWATWACPDKQRVPWNFSLCWNIFYYSGFLSNLQLPWKQSLPWTFSSPGGRKPPDPRLVRLCF